MRFLLSVVLISLLTVEIFATTGLGLSSIRQKAMGNSGVAITHDINSLHTNPAGLTHAKNEFKLGHIAADVTDSLTKKQDDIMFVLDKEQSQENQLKRISSSLVPFNVDFGAVGSLLTFTQKDLGFGLMTSGYGNFEMLNKIQPQLEFVGHANVIPSIGFSRKLGIFGQDVAFGVSGRYIYRTGLYNKDKGTLVNDYSITDLLEKLNNSQTIELSRYNMSGFGVDIGMLVPVSTFLGDGQIGVTAKNLYSELSGDIKKNNQATRITTIIPVVVTTGVGIQSELPFLGKFLWTVEYSEDPDYQDMYTKLHAGIEYPVFNNFLVLRAGVNQGYVTGGFGLDLFLFKINYAAYTYERGVVVGQDPSVSHSFDFRLFI